MEPIKSVKNGDASLTFPEAFEFYHFREVINQALNQTLSRTIITSGTVFLATMSLFIFGGGAINDFAFTFLAGILTGTYSSIYIASALLLWWHKGQRPQTFVTPASTNAAVTARA